MENLQIICMGGKQNEEIIIFVVAVCVNNEFVQGVR
jgi:hypothetical protein